MKTINKFNLKNGVLAAAVMVFGATACTSNFEELNTDPTGLTSLQAQQVGSFMQEAQRSIYYNQTNGNWEYQLIQNLNADLYSGYLAIPTPFASNNNNSQYVMMDGWNNQGFKDYFLHEGADLLSL